MAKIQTQSNLQGSFKVAKKHDLLPNKRNKSKMMSDFQVHLPTGTAVPSVLHLVAGERERDELIY